MNSTMIVPPWDQATVDSLNKWQETGWVHPFTCPQHDGEPTHVVLRAREGGWFCTRPGCDYTQTWAHAGMLNIPPDPLRMFTQSDLEAENLPERAGREGDSQPLPVASDTPIMHKLVQEDLESRLQVGIKRYGQPLQAFNGRNALRDAYEEVLDLAVYLRQAIWEKENPR